MSKNLKRCLFPSKNRTDSCKMESRTTTGIGYNLSISCGVSSYLWSEKHPWPISLHIMQHTVGKEKRMDMRDRLLFFQSLSLDLAGCTRKFESYRKVHSSNGNKIVQKLEPNTVGCVCGYLPTV